MKRFLALLLATLMVLSMVACGEKAEEPTQPTETPTEESTGWTPERAIELRCRRRSRYSPAHHAEDHR